MAARERVETVVESEQEDFVTCSEQVRAPGRATDGQSESKPLPGFFLGGQ